MHCGSALQALALALVFSALPAVLATTSPPHWLAQSWFFDWTAPGAPLPVPITAQCETIHINWQRGTATGPDPFAPYYLQIYSSNYVFPFIIPAGPDPHADLTIPFAPGSQYEICMFDTNGNTGGCQAIYTVYSNSSSTPTCANWTMPTSSLSVKSEYAKGNLSMYGWVDSCSDIKVTPQGGTPPFTFTVAPALHPPLNITSNDMSPINWTVSLSWASPFFISLVDSTGLSWSNGPIHSGNGDTSCLSAGSVSSGNQVMVGATVGATVGGVVFGSVISLLAAFLLFRRQRESKRSGQEAEPIPFISTEDHSHYDAVASQSPPADRQGFSSQQLLSVGSKQGSLGALAPISTVTLPREYQIEPFQQDGPSHLASYNSTTGSDATTSPQQQSLHDVQGTHARTASTSAIVPDRQEGGSQVYVIHHDSGRAPVSVITSRGTEVVELPPGYSSEYLSTAPSSQDPGNAQRRTRKTTPGPQ